MINKLQTKIYFLSLSTFIILIDQFTKYFMLNNHKILLKKEFLLFRLDFVKNYGAAFNLFSGSRIFLSVISLIITIILLYIILNQKNISNINLLSLSFILGGTIGNGFDRISKGYVIDFISLNFINFPIFNIADISINIGLIIFIYGFIKKKSY